MVERDNFYKIYEWMLSELKLKGHDLNVYALIYSFSRDGEGEFKGSIGYIQSFTGLSRSTVMRILKRLENARLIQKFEDEESKFNSYMAVSFDFEGPKMTQTMCQNETFDVSKWNTTRSKMTPNTDRDIYSDIDIDKRKKERKKENKKTSAHEKNFSDRGLVSHEDIMDEYEAEGEYRDVLKDFLRSSYLRGRIITNDELRDILERLYAHYGDEDEPKILSIRKAIAGGYFDVLELRGATGYWRTANFRRHLDPAFDEKLAPRNQSVDALRSQ